MILPYVRFRSHQRVYESTMLCVEEGERDDKVASPTRCTLHADRPIVLLNDAPGNGETKSHSWLRASVLGPIKTLEEPGQVGLLDAYSGVCNGDRQVLLAHFSSYRHLATIGRIFTGVFQDNQQHLLEVVSITRDDGILKGL